MCSNFSNSVNTFLNNNSSYTAETIKKELNNIADELYNVGKAITSIFTVNESTNMDKDGFTSLFASACDNSIDEVNLEQVDLLYSILDTDGDGNLSNNELSVFADSSGEITDFYMWQVVKDYSYEQQTENANSNDTASDSNNNTESADNNQGISGEENNNGDNVNVTENTGAGSNDDGVISGTPTENENIPVNSFDATNNPENVSVELKSCARDLWLAMDNNNNTKIDNDGTDEKKISDILNASDYTDEEFVDMVLYFENTYGLFSETENTMSGKKSLITLLAKELSGNDEKNAEEKFAERLVRAANAGDKDAVFLLSIEVYGATRGQLGTEETFLDAVFDNLSDSVIKDMNNYYDDMAGNNLFENTKGTMSKDIDADYSHEPSWFSRITRTYSSNSEEETNADSNTSNAVDKSSQSEKYKGQILNIIQLYSHKYYDSVNAPTFLRNEGCKNIIKIFEEINTKGTSTNNLDYGIPDNTVPNYKELYTTKNDILDAYENGKISKNIAHWLLMRTCDGDISKLIGITGNEVIITSEFKDSLNRLLEFFL